MFVYQKENNAVQMKVCQNFTINFINHLSNIKINNKIDRFGCTITFNDTNVLSEKFNFSALGGPKVAILWEDLHQAWEVRSVFRQGEGENLRGGAGKKCAVYYDFLIKENIISFNFK